MKTVHPKKLFGWTSETLQVGFVELLVRLGLYGLTEFFRAQPPFTRLVQREDWFYYFYPHTLGDGRAKHFELMVVLFYILIALILAANAFCSTRYQRIREEPVLKDSSESPSDGLTHPEYGDSTWFYDKLFTTQQALFWGITLALCSTALIVQMTKMISGRLRPDFIHRCQPENFDFANPDFSVLGAVPNCTNPEIWKVLGGRKSFPSRHAAISMCTVIFGALSAYHGLDTLENFHSVRFIIGLFLTLPGVYLSISRTMDYRHHWDDVLVGGLIGSGISYLAFRIYEDGICYRNQKKESYTREKTGVAEVASEGYPREMV